MRVVFVALLVALSSALPEVKTRLKKDAHRVGREPKFGYSADEGKRVVVSLDFCDRCDNYNLSGCVNPAPIDPLDNDEIFRPYHGAIAVDGVWYFDDKVILEKDDKTLKASISLAHDRLARKRVIMMKRDQSAYLEYDELMVNETCSNSTWNGTTFDHPAACTDGLTAYKTFCESTPLETVANEPKQVEALFHRRISRVLAGFGHLYINGYDVTADDFLMLETPETSVGVRGRLPVENATQLMEITGQTQEEAEEIMADFPGGLYFSTAPLDEAFPVPMSIMKEPDVVVLDGRIEWPADLECVPEIAGFQAVRSRAGLDSFGNETSSSGGDNGTDDGTEDTRRRTMERDEAERRRLHESTVSHCHDHSEWITYKGNFFCCQGRLKKTGELKPYHRDRLPWIVKNVLAGIFPWTWTANTTYSEKPATNSCKSLENEIFRLYDDFAGLSKGTTSVMGLIDLASGIVLNSIETAENLEWGLEKTTNAMKSVEAVAGVGSTLPYIGGLLGKLRQGSSKVRTAIDRKPNGPLEKLKKANKRIENSEVKEKACYVSYENEGKMIELAENTRKYDDQVKRVMKIDETCGENSPTGDICGPAWLKLHKDLNDLLDEPANQLKVIEDKIAGVADFLSVVVDFSKLPPIKTLIDIFEGLGKLLQPLTYLLNRRICVSVPLPVIKSKRISFWLKYPCGVKMCGSWFKYPCGVNWCHKYVSEVINYPSFEMKSFCFTVQQIIDGVLSVVDIVMNPNHVLFLPSLRPTKPRTKPGATNLDVAFLQTASVLPEKAPILAAPAAVHGVTRASAAPASLKGTLILS